MEVCCFVADFEVAKRVIETDLAGTKFADFTRIYDENAEPGAVAAHVPHISRTLSSN